MIADAGSVGLEDTDGGTLSFAGTTKDGIAAGRLDGADDAGRGSGASYADQLIWKGGRDVVDALQHQCDQVQ